MYSMWGWLRSYILCVIDLSNVVSDDTYILFKSRHPFVDIGWVKLRNLGCATNPPLFLLSHWG